MPLFQSLPTARPKLFHFLTFRRPHVNAFGEKSMLIVTALVLGLIITWLIATDSSVSQPGDVPVGVGIATTAVSDKT